MRFEVDHFELTGTDRLELAGRWSGIRGRRFLRPTLEVVLAGGEGRRRALASLDQKPWAAEEGEEWAVSFPWDGNARAFEEAELTVAPDAVLRLPGLGERGSAVPVVAAGEGAEAPSAVARVPSPPEDAELDARAAAAEREAQARAAAEKQAADAALAASKREADHAAERRSAAEEARDAAVAEADELRISLYEAEARAGFAEQQRDAAQRERDEAGAARAAAASERDAAQAARAEAEAERNAAQRERWETVREHDEAREAAERGLSPGVARGPSPGVSEPEAWTLGSETPGSGPVGDGAGSVGDETEAAVPALARGGTSVRERPGTSRWLVVAALGTVIALLLVAVLLAFR